MSCQAIVNKLFIFDRRALVISYPAGLRVRFRTRIHFSDADSPFSLVAVYKRGASFSTSALLVVKGHVFNGMNLKSFISYYNGDSFKKSFVNNVVSDALSMLFYRCITE